MKKYATKTTAFASALAAASCFTLIGASPAVAADVTFPDADSSGDLASEAAWGGTLPGPTDRPVIPNGKKTYTASADVSFAGISTAKIYNNTTITFDMTEAKSGSALRTVSLSSGFVQDTGSNRQRILFKGGVWNVGGSLLLGNQTYDPEDAMWHIISDGAAMNLAGDIGPSATSGGNCHFRITGAGTKVVASKALFQNDSKIRYEVADGASLELTGGDSSTPVFRTGDQGGARNGICATGAGSSIAVTGTDTFAWVGAGKGQGHFLRVENGASFSATNAALRIGSSASSSTETQTSTNHFVAVSGAGSSLVVTNIFLGYVTMSQGGAAFRNNVMAISDGASARTLGNASGAKKFEYSVLVGGIEYPSRGNTLLVTDSGSSLVCGGNLAVRGNHNSLVVTNGSVAVAGALKIPEPAVSTSWSMNGRNGTNRVEICGATGTISAVGAASVSDNSTLAFGIPSNGYAANVVPLTAKSLTVGVDSHIELNGVEERVTALQRGTAESWTLVETTDGVSIPAAVLSEANASMPKKCVIAVSGNALVLTVANPLDFTILSFR